MLVVRRHVCDDDDDEISAIAARIDERHTCISMRERISTSSTMFKWWRCRCVVAVVVVVVVVVRMRGHGRDASATTTMASSSLTKATMLHRLSQNNISLVFKDVNKSKMLDLLKPRFLVAIWHGTVAYAYCKAATTVLKFVKFKYVVYVLDFVGFHTFLF